MRIPRKLKKKIPRGFYCYTGMKMDWNTGIYHIKPCPFYARIKIKDMKPQPTWVDDEYIAKYGEEKDGWCKLIKCEIEDQCKFCGERER